MGKKQEGRKTTNARRAEEVEYKDCKAQGLFPNMPECLGPELESLG
jgi:hypothetical protein